MGLRAEKVKKDFIRKSKDTNVFTAVHPVDLNLTGGTLTELCGRSGSGKSTLLNMLAGLLKPSEGTVYIDDIDIYALEDKALSKLRNEKLGVIPQGHSAISSLTVLENVLLPLSVYERHVDPAYAMELLDMVGIAHLKDAMPSELSGGEMRRMAIARAFVTKPSIVLADEPTGDLDDENTEIVLRLLKEAAQKGAAVLLVTHEKEANKYADRIYRMNAGKLDPVL
ncbi:MAG: ABC transporter ATP-binding protein [Erysipelotrichaceae bacterium]|nr:ABC transporter ATP-binding protein [Erysipelotrichaceae bacterium]